MIFEKCFWGEDRWDITFGPIQAPYSRKEIRAWARRNMKHKYSVDISCSPGVTVEFWTFDDYKDAVTFSLAWSHV